MQARDAEANLASKTVKLRKAEAEDLIWEYAKYKALAVALNPVAFLDVLATAIADLALIRSLGETVQFADNQPSGRSALENDNVERGRNVVSRVGQQRFIGRG